MTKQKQVFSFHILLLWDSRLLFPLLILDVSTTWLESTCGELIWNGTHQSIFGPTVDSACQSKNQAMRLTELSLKLRDRIVSQIWGKGTKTFLQHWRYPRTQWPPLFLNGRSLEPPRLFLELASTAKLSNRSRSGRWPRTQWSLDRAPEFLCGDGRTFQKDKHLCSTPPNRPLW